MIEILNRKTDEGLAMTYLPGKKELCLCIRRGNSIEKYATVYSEEKGIELMEFISDMFHLERRIVPYEERLK